MCEIPPCSGTFASILKPFFLENTQIFNFLPVLKRYFFIGLRGLVLVGLLCCGVAGRAQQLQQAPWNDPAIVWLPATQARTAVLNLLQQIEPQLADLTPGSGQYNDLLRRIVFYKSILRGIKNALPLPQAIEAALPEAASLGGLYDQSFTPETTLRALFDEALDLLTS